MGEQPLVSIALATYNGQNYLKEQLESIYSQSYKNIEVVAVDDCSSDETLTILQEYAEKKGFRFYQNENNLGYVKNFERAISLCKGDYIALSDQDDIWLENKIEKLLENIGTNLLIHSDLSLIDTNGKMIVKNWKGDLKTHLCLEDFLFSNKVTGCSVLFHKELLSESLPFPDVAYHDWYLAVCAAKENKITYLNEALILYRQHTMQDTGFVNRTKYQALIGNKIERFKGVETARVKDAIKQLRNLKALESSECVSAKEKAAVSDAKVYFESFISSAFHPKMFFIGCRYSKHIYPQGNSLCIKNFLYDLIG